jgi:hypothetical protein
MSKTTIRTLNEINTWLAEHAYFEDSHVLSVNEMTHEIIVGYNIKGNCKRPVYQTV